jgi:hypothetical protein
VSFQNGEQFEKGPDKVEIKLRIATRNCNPQKFVETISNLSKHSRLASRIPYLKGEEVFGSCKKWMDLPPSSDMDSYRLNCVNFSMPKEGGRVVKGKTNASIPFANISESSSGSLKVFSRNGKEILETECREQMWHIECCRSIAKCFKLQANMKVKCTAQICRSKKRTPTPTYTCNKERPSYNPD